tara:strand:- start:2326 stop:2535 length:210 start_codon:yes stop_codon:yes gene_type:complete
MALTNDSYDINGVLISSTPVPADVIQAGITEESLAYLAETDWYVTRKFETGVAIPQEILIKRQLAREAI